MVVLTNPSNAVIPTDTYDVPRDKPSLSLWWAVVVLLPCDGLVFISFLKVPGHISSFPTPLLPGGAPPGLIGQQIQLPTEIQTSVTPHMEKLSGEMEMRAIELSKARGETLG